MPIKYSKEEIKLVKDFENKLRKRAEEINQAIEKGEKLFYAGYPVLKITTEPGWGLEAYAICGDGTRKYNCGSQIFDSILNEKGESFVTKPKKKS